MIHYNLESTQYVPSYAKDLSKEEYIFIELYKSLLIARPGLTPDTAYDQALSHSQKIINHFNQNR